MNWLAQNWVTVLLIGAMVAMHLFGHRHHGGHGGSHRGRTHPSTDAKDKDISGQAHPEDQSSPHADHTSGAKTSNHDHPHC